MLFQALAELDGQRDQIPPVAISKVADTLQCLVVLYTAKQDPNEAAHWEQRLSDELEAQSRP